MIVQPAHVEMQHQDVILQQARNLIQCVVGFLSADVSVNENDKTFKVFFKQVANKSAQIRIGKPELKQIRGYRGKLIQRDHVTAKSFLHSQRMELFDTAAVAVLNRWSINNLAPVVAIESMLLGCVEEQDFEIVNEKYHDDIDSSRTRLEVDQLKTYVEIHSTVLSIHGIRKAFKEENVL